MMPEQLLANGDVIGYFEAVHFLCLTCPPDVLRARLARRDGDDAASIRIGGWLDFDRTLMAAANAVPRATVLDAGRALDQVERDTRAWIDAHRHGRPL